VLAPLRVRRDRAHPLDRTLDSHTLEVVCAHTHEAFPYTCGTQHLVVRNRGEVRCHGCCVAVAGGAGDASEKGSPSSAPGDATGVG